jgi:uncharacterized protein YdeI (YjbR/CyaY-like superfamily)
MSAAGPRIEVASGAALWRWLSAHHARDDGLWLATPLKAAGLGVVSREEVLDALVAHGWIDGRRMKAGDGWTMQWISPRRQRDWAESYCRRAERLMAEGRMRPPGLASVEAARAAGRWRANPEVDRMEVPDDLASALAEGGADWFRNAAPSYRRNVLRWIAGAKRAETRARRVAAVAAAASEGRQVPQF